MKIRGPSLPTESSYESSIPVPDVLVREPDKKNPIGYHPPPMLQSPAKVDGTREKAKMVPEARIDEPVLFLPNKANEHTPLQIPVLH